MSALGFAALPNQLDLKEKELLANLHSIEGQNGIEVKTANQLRLNAQLKLPGKATCQVLQLLGGNGNRHRQDVCLSAYRLCSKIMA